MKELSETLKESLNESAGVSATKNVIYFTIDDNTSLPVMIAGDFGPLIWKLNYLVARKSSKGYELYLVTEPDSKFTNNPVDNRATGHLVPTSIFDFENPAKNLKFDFWKSLLNTYREAGLKFEKGENVHIEL